MQHTDYQLFRERYIGIAQRNILHHVSENYSAFSRLHQFNLDAFQRIVDADYDFSGSYVYYGQSHPLSEPYTTDDAMDFLHGHSIPVSIETLGLCQVYWNCVHGLLDCLLNARVELLQPARHNEASISFVGWCTDTGIDVLKFLCVNDEPWNECLHYPPFHYRR